MNEYSASPAGEGDNRPPDAGGGTNTGERRGPRVVDASTQPYDLDGRMEAAVAVLCCTSEPFWRRLGQHVERDRLRDPRNRALVQAARLLAQRGAPGAGQPAVGQALHELRAKVDPVVAAGALEILDAAPAVDADATISVAAPVVRRAACAEVYRQLGKALTADRDANRLLDDLRAAQTIGTTDAAASSLQILALDDVAEMVEQRPAWLVDEMVPARGITLLVGPSFAGKSRLAAGIGAGVSVGQEWCGRATRQGSVLWLAADRGVVAGYPAVWGACAAVEGASIRFAGEGRWSAEDPAQVDAMLHLAEEQWADLLVLDCARAIHTLDENSSEMRRVMAAVQRLAADRAVVLLHHATHEGRSRGSTDIMAASESILALTREGKSERLRLEVTHHVGPAETLHLREVAIDLGGFRHELREAGGTADDSSASLDERIVRVLRDTPNLKATEIRERVRAKSKRVVDAIASLVDRGVLVIVGVVDGRSEKRYVIDDDA